MYRTRREEGWRWGCQTSRQRSSIRLIVSNITGLFFVCNLEFTFSSQALDEEYLKVDAQFGGVDQRKIFTFAEKVCCE
jgi:hypothetical protein